MIPRVARWPRVLHHERWIVAAIAVTLVVLRSAVFLLWEPVFDSDEAVMGLMARHIAGGRAFPLFMYGQTYQLSLESWLAAPVFLLAGSSVAALRLPMLAMNVTIALLLLRQIERDVGLRPALALVPVLFFVVVAPGTAAHFTPASGGTLEPLLYVPLLWALRRRPTLAGVILGIALLHREFVIFGVVALAAVDALDGSLFTRAAGRRWWEMLWTASFVWLFAQWLKAFSPALGPGTSFSSSLAGHGSPLELASRFCFDASALASGFWRIVVTHWPMVFGVRPQPLLDFGIDSSVSQGLPGAPAVLAASMLLAAVGVAARLWRERVWRAEYSVCAYLVITAALSVTGYVAGRCGAVDVMRYELLSVLGAVGLGAWFLSTVKQTAVRTAWLALTAAVVLVAALSSVRLLAEYIRSAPASEKQMIVKELEARGVKYAVADYWLAYALTFLSGERIIVATEAYVRIDEYQRALEAHRGDAVRISRHGCDGGRPIRGGVFLCPLR
jgi:hypothetical protein